MESVDLVPFTSLPWDGSLEEKGVVSGLDYVKTFVPSAFIFFWTGELKVQGTQPKVQGTQPE